MCSDWLIAGVVKYTEVFCYNKATTALNLLFSSFVKKEWHCTHWLAVLYAARKIYGGK